MKRVLTTVRQEFNNFESSVVVHELELVINKNRSLNILNKYKTLQSFNFIIPAKLAKMKCTYG